MFSVTSVSTVSSQLPLTSLQQFVWSKKGYCAVTKTDSSSLLQAILLKSFFSHARTHTLLKFTIADSEPRTQASFLSQIIVERH